MMSRMPQSSRLSACPSCGEPLEPADRFCGACGVAVAAEQQAPEFTTPAPPDRTPPAGATRPAPPSWAPGTPAAEAGGAGPAPEAAAAPEVFGPEPGPDGPEHRPGGAVAAVAPTPPMAGPPPAGDPRATAGQDTMRLTAARRTCAACRLGQIDKDGYCERCGHVPARERDHMERELEGVAAVSDRGLRHHRNEDAFAVSAAALPDGGPAVVAVVCDGVSSATRPDDASAAACEAAGESLLTSLPRGAHTQQAMRHAILAAATAVNALAAEKESAAPEQRQQNAPACTLVSAVVSGGVLTVGWVGDSRVYWVPDDRSVGAARLTEDDSWAAQMVAAQLMSEAEAYADERAHAITGWLGADAYDLEPHTASFSPDRPGVVVVCTDGLWNYAESAAEMAAAVPADARVRPLRGAQRLVTYALEAGGHDNVTVALVPFHQPAPR